MPSPNKGFCIQIYIAAVTSNGSDPIFQRDLQPLAAGTGGMLLVFSDSSDGNGLNQVCSVLNRILIECY